MFPSHFRNQKCVILKLSLYYELGVINFNTIQEMCKFIEFFILIIVTETLNYLAWDGQGNMSIPEL
jgi:hypothetical protein